MDSNSRDKVIIWSLLAVLFAVFLSMVSNILLPFIVALIISYFINPIVDKIEKTGLSRTLSTLIITILFFLILGAISILIMPVMYEQFTNLLNNIPEYIKLLNLTILPKLNQLIDDANPDTVENAKEALKGFSGYIISFLAQIAGSIWNSGLAIINLLSLIFVTPVVTFYMLRDWNKMIEKITQLLPAKQSTTIISQIKEIDRTLSGYIHGQTNVCLLLGTFYALMLSFAGLDFGLFIGFATGILSFIPYVGMLIGLATGLLVAFFQFGDLPHILMIAAIFGVGNAIEGSLLTPKLVGDKVGLHPVWIIFGMLSGAAMFGFIGILVAVPVTSAIGVLARFWVGRYKESRLYSGT